MIARRARNCAWPRTNRRNRAKHALAQDKPENQARRAAQDPGTKTTGYQNTGMSHPNVKIGPTET